MNAEIFFPQERQRHALTAQLRDAHRTSPAEESDGKTRRDGAGRVAARDKRPTDCQAKANSAPTHHCAGNTPTPWPVPTTGSAPPDALKIHLTEAEGLLCIFRDIRPPIPTTSAHLYRGIRPALTRCREALVFDISFLAFRHVVEGLSFGRIVRRVRAGRRCAPAGRGWHLRRWVHQ